MPYVPATCPHCGGGLKLDSDMEKGYCIHCGSLISFADAVKTVRLKGPIEFEGYESLPTLMKLIEKDLKNGTNQTPEFRQHLVKALELDPDNEYFYDLVHSEIWEATIENNILTEYKGKSKKVVVPRGVEAIGKMAFARCPHMTDISLPKSLKRISEGAFIYESRLTIHSHNGTFAAKYAMSSPAKLKLLDIKNDNERNIEAIESILREFGIFKKITVDKIEKHFDRAYSTNWFLVFVIVSILVVLFMQLYNISSIKVIPGFFVAIFVLIASPILIVKIGYNEIRCKVATKKQAALFMKMCNDALKPLGIVDFKYRRNIFEDSHYDLESELEKLERARDKVIHMNLITVYKKPILNYSLIDYIKGKRPIEYKNKPNK